MFMFIEKDDPVLTIPNDPVYNSIFVEEFVVVMRLCLSQHPLYVPGAVAVEVEL